MPSASAIVTGFIVNHVQTRWALLVMGLVWALTQFPMVGTVGFSTLLACRIVLGAGEGPAYPVALHSTYKWFPNKLRTLPTAIIANIAGKNEEEFVAMAEKIGREAGLAALELNLSCPNVAGGVDFLDCFLLGQFEPVRLHVGGRHAGRVVDHEDVVLPAAGRAVKSRGEDAVNEHEQDEQLQ